MGIRLGELSPFITKAPAAGSRSDGFALLSQGFRDRESNRRAGVTEGMNARRQDEIERAAGATESFKRSKEASRVSEADREFKKQVFDQTWKLLQEGTEASTQAALNLGKEAGFDFGKMSPEEFQKQRATLEAEGKRDAARAAESAAKAAADEADEWLAGSGDEQAIAVDDVVRGGEGAIREMDAGIGQADASAQSEMVVRAANEALKRAGAAPGMRLGMGLPPAQQAPQQARPAPGPPQAPVQQQGPPQAQPQGAPPVRGLPPGMQAAMGGMPARPQPGPAPQAPGVTQSPTAFTWNGMRMDPYASRKALILREQEEKMAREVVPMQRSLLKQSQDPSLTASEQRSYRLFAEALPDAARGHGGDVRAALKVLAAGEGHKPRLDRGLKRDLKKRRGGGGGGGGGGGAPGGKRWQKEYDVGRRMQEKQMGRQGFDFQGARNSTYHLQDALADIASDNPTRQKKGLKSLATAREKGKVTDRDMLDLLGDQNLWETLLAGKERWTGKGGITNTAIQRQLVATITLGITRGNTRMSDIRKAAERVYGSAAERGGGYGAGARGYINEAFGKKDEAVTMDRPRTKAKEEPGDAAPKADSRLGEKYGY